MTTLSPSICVWRSNNGGDRIHRYAREWRPQPASAHVMCPPQQKGPIHSNTFCHGPNCKAVGFIVGTRYTCAYCPPSVDLCQDCYKSEPAHDSSHPFKQYDNPMTAAGYTYAMCPPQSHSQAQPHRSRLILDLCSLTCRVFRTCDRHLAKSLIKFAPVVQSTRPLIESCFTIDGALICIGVTHRSYTDRWTANYHIIV